MSSTIDWEGLLARFDALGGRVPDTDEYQAFCDLVTEHPGAAALAALDPFSAAYRRAAMDLYLDLRGAGRDGDYDPARDERSEMGTPADLWRDVPPWNFRQPGFVSEFLYSWAQIMRLLDAKPGDRVIEYGPGSGQILLMLARSGVRAFGVDIDAASLAVVRAQAEALKLDVSLEQNVFGEGFEGETFDRVIFFEAFHHAFEFEALLRRLRDRVAPGGRIVLCGEPIVGHAIPSIPYPWGPRLDALSIFCIRRYGWMELGFTEEFLSEAFRRAGWAVEIHPFPMCGRASALVAVRQDAMPDPAVRALELERDAAVAARLQAESARDAAEAECRTAWAAAAAAEEARRVAERQLGDAQARLDAFEGSTSWKVTAPLRLVGTGARRFIAPAGRVP